MKAGFLGLAAVVVGGVLAVGAFSAKADSDNSATVINRGTAVCGMPGADANGNLTFGGLGVVQTEVDNNNKVSIKCKGTGLTNASGSGQSFSGFTCGIINTSGDVFVTTDTHASVAANGNGTLTCTHTY